jgi:ABC-2 type transport system permease protein
MRFHRIWAVTLRHLYLFRRSYDKLTEAFYWPVVDLLLWGITSSYLSSVSSNLGNIIFALVGAVLFWNLIIRAQGDVSMGILEEVWNKNLVNLFVSPLRFSEWVSAFVILGIIKATASFTVAATVAFLLYKVSILQIGWYLFPMGALLLMTGWWLGFLLSGFILRYGTKVQTIAWTFVWIMSPFSAVYFPLSALPQWVQVVANFIPSSYVFESMRQSIHTGTVDANKLWISLGLNIVYLILALIFLRKSFNKVLQKGLVKVY